MMNFDTIENVRTEIEILSTTDILTSLEVSGEKVYQSAKIVLERAIVNGYEEKSVLVYAAECLIQSGYFWPTKAMKNGNVKIMGFSTVKKHVADGKLDKMDFMQAYSLLESLSNALVYARKRDKEMENGESEKKVTRTDAERVIHTLQRMAKNEDVSGLQNVAAFISTDQKMVDDILTAIGKMAESMS